jgi:hypothetical protein
MKYLSILIVLIVLSCQPNPSSSQNTDKTALTQSETIEGTKKAINPKYQDWVLFQNGTYIIFNNADTIPNIEAEAIKLMKEYGPVYGGSPAGDFSTTTLYNNAGWTISSHCYGMYTYVSPKEFQSEKPDDLKAGLYGRSKRNKDGENPIVIHINRKK